MLLREKLLKILARAATLCALILFTSATYAVESSYEHLADAEHLSIEQVIASNLWQKHQGTARFGYSKEAKWVRYSTSPAENIRIFTINNPWLLKIDVFLVGKGKVIRQHQTGSSRPSSQRRIRTPGIAIPVPTDIEQIYIYDHGASASNFPVALMSGSEFTSFSSALSVFHGMFYGIVLIMLIYNLAIYFATKDKTYLYFSLFAASLSAFLSTADGMGSLLLWPDTPGMQYLVTAMGWGFAMVFLLEFALQLLPSQKSIPQVLMLHRICQLGVVVVTLGSSLNPSPSIYAIQTIASTFVLSLLVYDGIQATFRKSAGGKLFLFANGAFVLGSVVHIAMLFGWITASVWVQHAVHIGFTLEMAILSIALVHRLRSNERRHWQARQTTQELSRRNKELRTAQSLAEEHRQLQKSLQQAQKLKTIGQMAGGFAHDFNNILASILGYAELAQDSTAQKDRTKLARYLGEIHSAGERGATLVKQLLQYSRNAPTQPQKLHLGETLDEIRALLRGSLPATVTISTHLPKTSIYAYIDPEQLQQMMVNLCLNAAESMRNRGDIDIRLDVIDITNLTCTSCLKNFSGSYICIVIEDNGTGITGRANDLFTPFHTSKDVGEGTGLGLSVVHGIAHEYAGHIHATNRATNGARFTLYLPTETAQVAAPTKGRRILVIEDDPSVAGYLSVLLDCDDFETTVKSLPIQALETFVADPYAFDLVITDYLMPHSTGLELAEDIHALRPDLPVILTTGNVNNIEPNALAHAGVNCVFQKPLNAEQLLAKIRGLLTQ